MAILKILKAGPARKRPAGSLLFRGVLVLGLFLALLLLIQSFVGYFRLSRQLIADQLGKEAERQTLALERELRSSGAGESARLMEVLEETQREAPQKLAWIKILDAGGKVLFQTDKAASWPISAENIHSAFGERVWISETRDSEHGKVRIAVLPLRIRTPRAAPISSHPGATAPTPAPPAPRLIEMAIYLDSVAAAYGPLRHNLITSCLAAISLAIAIALLWLQFPRFIRGKQLEKQLEMARQVQADLLPPADPAFKGMDFAASCVAAWQVGGDFYDVFSAQRGRTAFVLGDVSGKGIPAALLMGMLHGAVRAMGWSDTDQVHEASTGRLNELLESQTSSDRFASLFWGYFDPESQNLRYVNAGHLPPALIRRNNDGALNIRRLTEGGPVLGVLPAALYRQGEAAVQPGDLLVLYSDGIVEASTAAGEEFGEDRLWAAIQANWDRSSSQIRDAILGQVRSFLHEEQPQDDITLMIVRLGGEPESKPEWLLQPPPQKLELPVFTPSFQLLHGAAGNSFTSI